MAHYPLHHLLHNPSSFISLTLPQHSPRLQTLSLPKTLSCHLSSSHNNKCSSNSIISSLTKIHSKPLHFALSGALSLCLLFGGITHYSNSTLFIYLFTFYAAKYWKFLNFVGAQIAEAATKAGVNKPELLPKEFSTVIDVAGFLSDGQVLESCLDK